MGKLLSLILIPGNQEDCSHLSQYQTDISSKVPEKRNNMDDTDRKHLICH